MAFGLTRIRRERSRGTRRILVALTVGATLLASAGSAYAQTGGDGSSVDQYVEDVPTASGSVHPGVGSSHQTKLPSSIGSQISSQGGADAGTLRALATKSEYGGQPTKKGSSDPLVGTPGRGESIAGANAESDGSAGDALSSAVSAVQGGEAARLVGLLIVLFCISVATLTAAGLRQRRRAQ
jgi:hypothetical protein